MWCLKVFAPSALERKAGHGGNRSIERNHLSSPAELMPSPLCKQCLIGVSHDFERKEKLSVILKKLGQTLEKISIDILDSKI